MTTETHNKALSAFLQKRKTPLLCVIAIVLLAVVLSIVFSGSGDITFRTETALKRIVEQERLSTAEFTYNSIATATDDKGKELCHIAYEGTVKAGFDFDDITVKKKGKTVILTIPEITILSVNVQDKLDYIFIKEKYNTETFYSQARQVCQEDLEKKAAECDALTATARNNAVSTITALMTPLSQSLEKDGYALEIHYTNE